MRFIVHLLGVAAPMLGVWATAPAMAQGEGAHLFAQNCSACHQLTGKGIPGAFPALAGDAFVQGPPKSVAALLIKGRGGMPSFRDDLSNAQIAAILTYVRSSWGNHAPAIDKAVVSAARGGGDAPSATGPMQAH